MARTFLAALAIASVILSAPLSAATATSPREVYTLATDDGILVVWVQDGPQPDAFLVYGLGGEEPELLATTDGASFSANVPAGYAAYAVSAMSGDVESPSTQSKDVGKPCVKVDTRGVAVSLQCIEKSGGVYIHRP